MRLIQTEHFSKVGRSPTPRQSRRSMVRRERWTRLRPYVYLLPAILFLTAFLYVPVALATGLSFFEWNMVSPAARFVGVGNYADLLTSTEFIQVLLRSVMYVLIALVGNFVLPVGLAILTLRVGKRASDVYQGLLFAPTVVATAVAALVWQFIYLPAGGPLNALLSSFGVSGANWLGDPVTALPAVGVMAAWKHFGFNYLIALAGLVAVPREYLEAARVDGAAGFTMLRYVLVPLLMPTLLFLMLSTVLQALPQVFVPIEVLTGGGPDDSSSNLLYDMYRNGFRFFQVGVASAEAVILMALFGGAAVWQFSVLERNLIYDR